MTFRTGEKGSVLVLLLLLFYSLSVIGVVPANSTYENQRALVDSLNAKSSLNWYDNPDETIKLAERALVISREIEYRRGEAEALNNIGVGYYFSSDYDKVLDYYIRTLDTYEEIGDEDGITRVGTLYFRIVKYQKALENYKAGLEVSRKSGDREKVGELIANIAIWPTG
jgi:tetratricopeptide (TPR) repeat protein